MGKIFISRSLMKPCSTSHFSMANRSYNRSVFPKSGKMQGLKINYPFSSATGIIKLKKQLIK